jgi:DNA-directed RNA polymerase alpha subunit
MLFYADTIPDEFEDLFDLEQSKRYTSITTEKTYYPGTNSTKLESYKQLDILTLDKEVYQCVQECTITTRQEIAKLLHKELCTISGCVTRLIKAGWIKAGEKVLNESTGRNVQSLTIKRRL